MRQLQVTIMVSEKDIKKRNGSVTKFVIHEQEPQPEVGDYFYGNTKTTDEKISRYEISEIVEIRKATVKNHNYVTAVTAWMFEPINKK